MGLARIEVSKRPLMVCAFVAQGVSGFFCLWAFGARSGFWHIPIGGIARMKRHCRHHGFVWLLALLARRLAQYRPTHRR